MHASVVTCGSEYFREMLDNAVYTNCWSLEVHEMQPRVLERVVEWLYSGELGEISDYVEGRALLEGSRFLRVERLEAQCRAWLVGLHTLSLSYCYDLSDVQPLSTLVGLHTLDLHCCEQLRDVQP